MVGAVGGLFALALVAPLLQRLARGLTGWLLALVPAAIAVIAGMQTPAIAGGARLTSSLVWSRELGVNLAFALDGLSLLFVLLICGIGALVLIYASGYMKGDPMLGRFYSFLLVFMAAMFGLVLANNVLTLFVFWELTSISSFLLIGFTHNRAASRTAARQALIITGGGGLALLIGLIMLGLVGGSYDFGGLRAQSELVRSSTLYMPILLLVLVGAFTKSAQVPFHFWLPGAMEAPTPVSAFLHSATMVKAGIYLVARMSPILGGTEAWMLIISTVGALTMLVGGILALYQLDMKRVLAYSTVSALGTIMLLLGLGTPGAIEAAMTFLLAHALYKGALFMVAGAIDHETGTRDLSKLGGLRRSMPLTAAVAVLAAVSLSGFGPVLSFIAKELLFEAVLDAETNSLLLTIVAVLAGGLFVADALIVSIKPFFGEARHTPKHPHEAPISMLFGPALLALAGLVIGLLPGVFAEPVLGAASGAVLGEHAELSLYLWHGLNVALALSVVSVLVGGGLYASWVALRTHTAWVDTALGTWPARAFQLVFVAINALGRRLTILMQSGYLRYYLMIILLTTVVFVGTTLVTKNGLPPGIAMAWSELRFYEAVLAVLMLLAAIFAVFAPGRLSTVAALGIVGYGVALIYILYGAPDLAMTQILVETLTVLLFVLAFYHLPSYHSFSTIPRRLRDAAIAISVGGLMTLLVLSATATPPESRLADYFIENSKKVAHGSNIVNVILVDFRGLDTLGEATVLGVAAFGVFALLKLGRTRAQEESANRPLLSRFRLLHRGSRHKEHP